MNHTLSHFRVRLQTLLLIAFCVSSMFFDGRIWVHATVPFDPLAEYGPVATYSIARNGKPIGKHTVRFSRPDELTLMVDIVSNLKVRFLGIPVYTFQYTAKERWESGRLQSMTATKTEKGASTTLEMQRNAPGMTLRDMNGTTSQAAVEFASNHWNPAVLDRSRVLNTLTGKVNSVEITSKGTQQLFINGEPANTHHYRYSGELQVDVWYDDRQRWVKLAFQADDDSHITYLSEGFSTP